MTHQYNAREKRARRKAKAARKLEVTRKAIAAAGKSKPKSENQN